MNKYRNPTSYRLSELALALLAELADRNGLSNTGFLEFVLRKEAREQGINEKDIQDKIVSFKKE